MSKKKKQVPRGPKGRRRYAMDFIPDKELYKAVMFARKMIREGKSPGLANHIAAQYYDFYISDIAYYTAQAAGTYSGRRKRRN